VLFGGLKPGSRPQNWQFTIVPGTLSSGKGTGGPPLCAKVFMSIVYTPLQSLVGAGLPPEFDPAVRLIGPLTHSVPPWKGVVAGPLMPYSISPDLLLRMFEQLTVKPLPALALEAPLKPMVGVQPKELSFAVQYVVGALQPPLVSIRKNASGVPKDGREFRSLPAPSFRCATK
jgi:hypothetical protein